MSAVVSTFETHLRAMQEGDLPAVLDIELQAYEFPWTLGIFRDCLRFRYVCKVCEGPQGVLGYGIMSLGAGECHILNICVNPAHQGQGVGTRLITHLLDAARQARVNLALLEVRDSNKAAFQLYTKLGFNEIGVRRGYYPARRGREDAIVLARQL